MLWQRLRSLWKRIFPHWSARGGSLSPYVIRHELFGDCPERSGWILATLETAPPRPKWIEAVHQTLQRLYPKSVDERHTLESLAKLDPEKGFARARSLSWLARFRPDGFRLLLEKVLAFDTEESVREAAARAFRAEPPTEVNCALLARALASDSSVSVQEGAAESLAAIAQREARFRSFVLAALQQAAQSNRGAEACVVRMMASLGPDEDVLAALTNILEGKACRSAREAVQKLLESHDSECAAVLRERLGLDPGKKHG